MNPIHLSENSKVQILVTNKLISETLSYDCLTKGTSSSINRIKALLFLTHRSRLRTGRAGGSWRLAICSLLIGTP